MAVPESKKKPLVKGRNQTDKSLRTERAKIDNSLVKGITQTQDSTDDVISSDRADADEARLQVRVDIDQKSVTKHSEDSRIIQERRKADDALESERRLMDSALEKERSQNKTAGIDLFESERHKTDQDLTHERAETDKEVERVIDDLSKEKSEHVATRSALTTRDEFLAIVSHDLRNPLGTILIAADQLMTHPIYISAEQEIRQYIEMISRSAGEGLRLIGDLLDMERMAGGNLNLQIGSYDIYDIVQQTVKTFQLSAATKHLSLIVESNENYVSVLCDRDRITQVISNLINNAIKFTPYGGKISLKVVLEKNDVQIFVTDSGIGIPQNMLKTIFEKFGQIGKTDRRGLGLGLYISKMIVEAHRGRIFVKSKIESGSCFCFTLPRTSEI